MTNSIFLRVGSPVLLDFIE